MVEKQQHTSLEFLSHPGETLAEILAERGLSQKELAIRSGVSEKHISSVINGNSKITSEFALKLAFSLDGDPSFWTNLQANHDFEQGILKEKENITDKERDIARQIKEATSKMLKTNFQRGYKDEVIMELRKHLGLSNLQAIVELNSGIYRQQFTKGTNEYIMYVWQYLSEKSTNKQEVASLDIAKLKEKLPKIKEIMFSDKNILHEIRDTLNSVGVLFTAQQNVKGAPVNGLTVKSKRGYPLIALTIRNRYRDIFWFTLFHEIAHVVNGDYNKKLTDEQYFEAEEKANLFARNLLIDEEHYKKFIKKGDFTNKSIIEFAQKNNVITDIVVGRLMKDKMLDWSNHNLRNKYEWAENSKG